jgi:hypothetical protein
VARVDHLGQRLAEEIGMLAELRHQQNSQESDSDGAILGGLDTRRNPRKPSVHAG